jgi:tRNA (cytidine/uridine-2'-O-)-methyltransferase
MLHVALLEPEIPPNTGNVARLCAATGAVLHLIGRLGFQLDDRSLRRAGLDYWDALDVRRHDSLEAFEALWAGAGGGRLFCFSAHAETPYTQVTYRPGDCLLFGGESHGLPAGLLRRHADRAVVIPMPAGKVRSLNLATAVGIALYEALRQLHGW